MILKIFNKNSYFSSGGPEPSLSVVQFVQDHSYNYLITYIIFLMQE